MAVELGVFQLGLIDDTRVGLLISIYDSFIGIEATLVRQSEYSRKNFMTVEPKSCVLVKGTAGLGNRILCLLTASLYAVAANRRLLVDWRDPIFTGRSGIAPDLFSELFASPLADPLPERIESQSVAPSLWQGRLNETLDIVGRDNDPIFYDKFGSFRKLAIRLSRIDYSEDVLVFWSFREVMRPIRAHLVRIDEQYRKMSDLEILRQAAQKYAQPNERVQSITNQFVSEHFRDRMLGLHIRATDLRAPVEKLLSVAGQLVKKYDCKGVFCATDNAEVEDRARQLLPNLVTLPKQLPKGSIPLHYDPSCQDRVERATQALVDMLLLSRCPTLAYASRSSFGLVGNIYAQKEQVAVDVDRFNLKVQGKRFVQSWIY